MKGMGLPHRCKGYRKFFTFFPSASLQRDERANKEWTKLARAPRRCWTFWNQSQIFKEFGRWILTRNMWSYTCWTVPARDVRPAPPRPAPRKKGCPAPPRKKASLALPRPAKIGKSCGAGRGKVDLNPLKIWINNACQVYSFHDKQHVILGWWLEKDDHNHDYEYNTCFLLIL